MLKYTYLLKTTLNNLQDLKRDSLPFYLNVAEDSLPL